MAVTKSDVQLEGSPEHLLVGNDVLPRMVLSGLCRQNELVCTSRVQ